jgi:GT2 family glycosyltransferase
VAAVTAERERERADISVAVATCGRPDALARCLAALAAGTRPPHEVIVVDQDPSDRARAAVRAAGAELNARYVAQPRLGLSASRNLALSEAAATVVAVTDDDCAPAAGWVAAIAAAFARTPVPAAVSGPIATLGPRPAGGHAISLRSVPAAQDLRGRMLPWDAGSGANFAAPRALLLALGGWDERLGVGSPGKAAEDADLLYRILRSGAIVRYDPAVVVHHDWQTWERRLATRSSSASGAGALCGLWLRRADGYALRMLLAYVRMHAARLAGAARQRDRARIAEHTRALRGVLPGLIYGVRAGGRTS